jgi:hypothetical protein
MSPGEVIAAVAILGEEGVDGIIREAVVAEEDEAEAGGGEGVVEGVEACLETMIS